VFSPLVHSIGERIGIERAIGWSVVVLALGAVWRSLRGGALNLWLGTVLVGAALAVGNVLMPALVRRDFSTRIPLVMGVYSGVLGGFGAIAAGIVAPLSAAAPGGTPLGWRTALLLTVGIAPVTLAVWIIASRAGRHAPMLGPGGAAAAGETGEAVSPAPRATLPRDAAGRRIWTD